MKIFGWILVVVGSLNLITAIATFSTGVETVGADRVSRMIGTNCGVLVLGVFLIQRAAQRANEQKELEDWLDKS